MVDEEILSLIREHADLAWRGDPQSDDQIDQAEKDLGVLFPKDFRAYLRELGWLAFGPNEYTGLGIATLNVVSVTKRARERSQLPCNLVVIADHDGDEFVCLDCSTDFTGRVVIWDVPSRSISRVRADDFVEFLKTDIAGFLG